MASVVTFHHVTNLRKVGILLTDTVAINKIYNSSVNSHKGVSKHHQKGEIYAVLAEVQITVTGESAAKRQSMMQTNSLTSSMTPGNKTTKK